jgi:ADP-ribosyl-[dinitrogen reductase] hydrolase
MVESVAKDGGCMDIRSRFQGSILGMATGDAMGAAFEFKSRGQIPEIIEDMAGGGCFGWGRGQWTDDTAMAVCLGASLLHCRGFNFKDQIERYCLWYKDRFDLAQQLGLKKDADMSEKDYIIRCGDIGNTTRKALDNYLLNGDPKAGSRDPMDSGNGSIMRLAPVPLMYWKNIDLAVKLGGDSSITTHGSAECIDACRLLSAVIVKALNGSSKKEVLAIDPTIVISPKIVMIAKGKYQLKTMDQIKGSGYVTESLEAALWCFYTANTFEEAIIAAIRLGDDTDTTAAITGQIAGAFYGVESIPQKWLDKLWFKNDLQFLADKLFELG